MQRNAEIGRRRSEIYRLSAVAAVDWDANQEISRPKEIRGMGKEEVEKSEISFLLVVRPLFPPSSMRG